MRIIAFLVLLLLGFSNLGHGEDPKTQKEFLDVILNYYSANGSYLTHDEFTAVLNDLGLDQGSSSSNFEAMKTDTILEIYNITTLTLYPSEIASISPAVISQLVEKNHAEPESQSETKRNARTWGFATLATCIVCMLALLGFPLRNFLKLPLVMNSLIGLGVGVLVSDAALHLLPDVLGGDKSKNHYITISSVVFVGVYSMFLLEKLFELIVGEGHSHGHQHTPHGEMDIPADVDLLKQRKSSVEVIPSRTENGAPHTDHPLDHSSDHHHSGQNHGDSKPKENASTMKSWKGVKLIGWMILLNDGLHNFVDGLAIGASFTSSEAVGWATTLAVALHEIPHEVADFAILIRAGFTMRQAVFFNFLSALTALGGCFAGVAAGELNGNAQDYILALTAGTFMYMALANLLLMMELRDTHSFIGANLNMMIGFVIMFLIAFYESSLESLGGESKE